MKCYGPHIFIFPGLGAPSAGTAVSVKDSKGAAGGGTGADADRVIPDLLANPALDTKSLDLSPTSRAVLNESAQEDLKRTIIALEAQLDQSIANHRNDVASFRLRDEESQSKLRSLDEQLRAARNHIVDIEARYEELMVEECRNVENEIGPTVFGNCCGMFRWV